MNRVRAVVSAVAAGAITACGLTGCTAAGSVFDDVAVVVYQPRTDIQAGRLAIQVHNGGSQPLHVVGARLSSPDFSADTVWPNDTATVPAGHALDLRAPLPEVRCDGEPDPVATIEISRGTVTEVAELPVDDPYDLLPRLHREACLGEEIAAIATLTPLEVILPAGQAPAILVIGIEPTGAPGSVTLESVAATTLLKPTVDGRATDQAPVAITIDADGPTEVRIPFVPNRCDPHALMEDKVGTIIPLYVSTATTRDTRWLLPVTDEQRAAFYAFFAAYCGLPAG